MKAKYTTFKIMRTKLNLIDKYPDLLVFLQWAARFYRRR
jgi:hypothetical protein